MRADVLEDRGAGSPVIYIPGIDGTGELLLGTAKRIEAGFRLVRTSYRAEPVPRERAAEVDTYPALAASIAARCEELGLPGVLVLAESFGGAVALQLALERPDLVRGLLIVNSFARYPARERLAWARLGSPLVPRFAFDLGRRLLAAHALFGLYREPAAIAAFRGLPGTFFDGAYHRRLAMIESLDLVPRLPEVRCPAALVAGDADRIVPSVACLSEMAAGLPDATLEVVPGGGHMLLPLASQPWEERLARLAARADAAQP